MLNIIKRFDRWLLFWALLASVVGIFIVFDASYVRSMQAGRGVFSREAVMQVVFLGIAFLSCLWLASWKPQTYQRGSKALWCFSLVTLLLVEIPGVGVAQNGAHRWIGYGSFLIQPAEFAKLAVVVYLAGLLSVRKPWPKELPKTRDRIAWLDKIAYPKFVRVLPAIWVLAAVVLIEKEPDLGTAAVVAFTGYVMFLQGGISRASAIWGTVIAALGVGLMIMQEPYRMERIENHFHRWDKKNTDETGFQTVQSEFAMATGGVLGVGPGGGRAKTILPAATTDFVMATVGEEFGLIGSMGVIVILSGLTIRLLQLASQAKEKFASLVCSGVASWIGIQTAVNIMMANGTLPAIGIPLPFISSGGSSLIALWMAIGVCESVRTMQPELLKKAAVLSAHDWDATPSSRSTVAAGSARYYGGN